METRIRHLHYRVIAAPGTAVPPGLERMARERVGEALGDALETALGHDQGVYVLRTVRADLSVDVAAHRPDRLIAKEWADRLAAAITRSIAEDGDDRVARFADEAELIARFAVDLAGGVAWERWYYAPFAELRPLGPRAALRTVLLENRRQLPAILAWLVRHGRLERVLAALDGRTLAALGGPRPEPELVRPLLAVALRIAERLELIAARSAADVLLAEYLAASRGVPSWRDRSSLAGAVLDAFTFLVRRGDARLPREAESERARRRLEAVLGELDWLEVDTLRAGLHDLLSLGPEPGRRAADPAPTPGELALVAELARAAAAATVAFDLRDPAGTANALRLRAALAAEAPEAAARPEAAETIATVLAAVERLARHRSASEVWALLATGDAPRAWRRYADAGGSRSDVELLSGAEELVRRFAPGAPTAGAEAGGPWIESPCAGALLPARGALDLRLPALAAELEGVPPFRELLLALALRWGGEGALGARADAGLSAALGFPQPPTAEELILGWSACTAETHERLRSGVLRALEARGLGLPVDDDALACMRHSTLGDDETDLTVAIVALAAIRAWTGWLHGFGESSPSFVLDQFVRRPGSVALGDGRALIELERRPLDLVLEMSGYLGELDAGALLPRRVVFALAEG